MSYSVARNAHAHRKTAITATRWMRIMRGSLLKSAPSHTITHGAGFATRESALGFEHVAQSLAESFVRRLQAEAPRSVESTSRGKYGCSSINFKSYFIARATTPRPSKDQYVVGTYAGFSFLDVLMRTGASRSISFSRDVNPAVNKD